MARSESYRPGLLSALLLGAGAGDSGVDSARAQGSSAPQSPSTNESEDIVSGAAGLDEQVGGNKPSGSTPEDQSASAKKKKKSKKKGRKDHSDGASLSSPVKEGSGGGAAAMVAGNNSGVATHESLRPAAEAPGLASLFSPNNLKKFKRRERSDKEADAAEVSHLIFVGRFY